MGKRRRFESSTCEEWEEELEWRLIRELLGTVGVVVDFFKKIWHSSLNFEFSLFFFLNSVIEMETKSWTSWYLLTSWEEKTLRQGNRTGKFWKPWLQHFCIFHKNVRLCLFLSTDTNIIIVFYLFTNIFSASPNDAIAILNWGDWVAVFGKVVF